MYTATLCVGGGCVASGTVGDLKARISRRKKKMEDLMEDNQWYNIQDPIKQMITSITKAVRTQSAGIRDLDRKIGMIF